MLKDKNLCLVVILILTLAIFGSARADLMEDLSFLLNRKRPTW